MKKYYVQVTDCCTYWYLDPEFKILHRDGAPAIEHKNGDKHWYSNGKCHCTDGPAVVRAGGLKMWYLDGKHVYKRDFDRLVKPVREMTLEQVEKMVGSRVKIVESV